MSIGHLKPVYMLKLRSHKSVPLFESVKWNLLLKGPHVRFFLFSYCFLSSSSQPSSDQLLPMPPAADHPHADCLPADHPRVGYPPTDHPPAGRLTAAPTARAAHAWLHRPRHPLWWQCLRTCGHATVLLVRLVHGGSASQELSHGEF
jgi:hypothetical protein